MREVGQQAAEPALVHVIHAAALRFFRDRVLRLPLGADKEQRAALRRQVGDEVGRLLVELGRPAQVDDVDAVPFAENERLHLRVPALRLVSEVDARLQEIFHRDRAQATAPVSSERQTSRMLTNAL